VLQERIVLVDWFNHRIALLEHGQLLTVFLSIHARTLHQVITADPIKEII